MNYLHFLFTKTYLLRCWYFVFGIYCFQNQCVFCFSIVFDNKVLSLLFSSSVSKTSSSEEIADEAYEQQYSGARPAKRLKLIDSDGPMRIANPKDNRQWTALHKEAANVNNRTLSSLSVLTPPQEGQECTTAQHSDVNAVGPGGVTPLMLAASRGNYLDGAYEDENSDDSGAQVCYSMFIQLDFSCTRSQKRASCSKSSVGFLALLSLSQYQDTF